MKLGFGKVIDFFLLQKDFYSRLTDKSMWLYIGIAFVGIRNVFFSILMMRANNVEFSEGFHLDVRTISILLATALIIGLFDVISFSYPIFDIIKHFKRKSKSGNSAISPTLGMAFSSFLTKVMKVYILVNLIITPLDIICYFTSSFAVKYQSILFFNIASMLGILAYFWFNGAITRGLCVLFKIPNSIRALVFVLVFLWNALLSTGIGYLLDMVQLYIL